MEKNVKIIIGIVISLIGIIVLGSDYYLSLKHEVFDDMNKKYYEQNVVVDDLTKKIKTLDGVFNLVDAATNKVGYLTSKVIDGVMSVVNKIIGLRKRKEEDDFYE